MPRLIERLLPPALILALLAVPAATSAQTVHYAGPHPIAKHLLRGMCYIPGPHTHSYSPPKQLLFVKAGRHWRFVGDPVEYEIEAPKHPYYGHHPVFWVEPKHRKKHYCYITGPHHHWRKPPGKLTFKKKGKLYWFVGQHPPGYQQKHWRAQALRTHYHSIGIPLPVAEVGPPAGFVGMTVGPAWFKGHVHLKWKKGRFWAAGPKLKRWRGHRWKRPKWRRGHWKHKRWNRRWKRRLKWKRGMRHGRFKGMGHRLRGGMGRRRYGGMGRGRFKGMGRGRFKGMGHRRFKGMGHRRFKGMGRRRYGGMGRGMRRGM